MRYGNDVAANPKGSTLPFTPPLGPVPANVPFEDITVDFAGLALRYRLWGDPGKPLLVLQHGARDHARSWDFVVAALAGTFCIAAPDLRGHGDSAHVPGGGYDTIDFVSDFAAVLSDLERRGFVAPFRIVGHSLGGNIASHYAAAYPDRVEALVNMEGVGVSPSMYEQTIARPAHERWRGVADRRLDMATKPPRTFATPELAVRRMRQLHKNVPDNIVEHVALHAIRSTDEGYRWKYDQLIGMLSHRPEAPPEYLALYQAVSCPVLLMYGTGSFATPPDRDGRGTVFPRGELVLYEGVGHWLHHERLNRFLGDLGEFFSRAG